MSPSDKHEGCSNSDQKEERENQRQEVVKPNGMDQSLSETTSSTTEAMIPDCGTVTNIPLFTAKLSTFKCSDNVQMKTFDPGESSNNENVINTQCSYPLKFPIKNSNSVSKNNKTYKAGSKINKLADMLAKRSQNLVEMTQNVTSEVIADIISAPKVENDINAVDNSEFVKEDKLEISGVISGKTASNQPINSENESQNKSVPNENSGNVKQLNLQMSHKCSSDISEVNLQETNISEFNALKEHLVKSETDGSTKSKKEIRKNLKNVELPLILPEKKRRSSPRNKLVSSEISKDCTFDSYHEGKSSVKSLKSEGYPVSEETKSIINPASPKVDKARVTKQRKSKRLVETSTQTSTTDFVCLEVKKSDLNLETAPALEQARKSESDLGKPVSNKTESLKEQIIQDVEIRVEKTVGENMLPSTKETAEEKSENTEERGSIEKSESSMKWEDETNSDELLKSELDIKETEKCIYACLYCTATFIARNECKDHEKSHSPKKNKQITKCQFCNKQSQSFYDLKLHCIKNHPNKYAYCIKCDERFCEKTQLYTHNKSLHLTKAMEEAQNLVKLQETLGLNLRHINKEYIDEMRKVVEKKGNKATLMKSDLKVDVSFDITKKSTTSPRTVQKVSPRENKTEEQLLEMEMLFYSNLSGNIKENLTNHLDGKIDKNGNPIQTEETNDSSDNNQAKLKSTNLLSVVTASSSGTSDQVPRAPSPYQTRSKTPNPLPPTAKKFKKLPNWQQKFWEKYNFPTNYRYEHRFWDKNYLNPEKSALYLKDLSCLDIKTQLIIRENIKKLDSIKNSEETNKSGDKLTFPEYLSLIPKVNDRNGQRNTGQTNNTDCLKGKYNSNEEKKLKNLPTDLNYKSRRKISADQSKSTRQSEKNSQKISDGVKMMTRRQSVIELSKFSKKNEDTGKKRKGSLDVAETQKMTLRRQTSLDNFQRLCGSDNSSNDEKTNQAGQEPAVDELEDNPPSPVTGIAEISGEWVRPRSYLCGTCCCKFTNLWELEDHKWVSHPNVWCTHYEFEDDKIDKLFHRSDVESSDESGSNEKSLTKLKLTDLYKRYLLPHGSLKTAKLVPNLSFPEQCTKCKKDCMNLSDMHKHMLDCGGDNTWFLTMYSSPMTMKRKWRPFGSRRRKQIGRRMVKRNIPNTSNMRPYHYQHRIRTKPGDVESIQKMLANLPEKRARRAINFDEIKTRSQATIHSNRLLRKRFKVSFGTNIMRLKALKQQRQVKKKESSSKSTTDTSSENTPTGSPKRRNKMKDNAQLPKEENLVLESIEDIERKKKAVKQVKKKDVSSKQVSTKKPVKKENKTEIGEIGKRLTRSNSFGIVDTLKESREKKKKELNESLPRTDVTEVSRTDGCNKKNLKDKSGKVSKKKGSQKVPDKVIKKELIISDVSSENFSNGADDLRKKTKTDDDDEILTSPESNETFQGKESEKVKKGKLPSKNILRLKSNDKDKTELIKRIQKTLKNSKKILEKREIKDKNEIRRSLRIQTLQLTDVSPKLIDDIVTPEKNMKESKESHSQDTQSSRSPQLNVETQTTSSAKKSSKPSRNLRGNDSKNNSGEITEVTSAVRRSSRTMSGVLPEEKQELLISESSTRLIDNTTSETGKKLFDGTRGNSSEANQSELVDTMKRSAILENSRIVKVTDNNSDPLNCYEFESIKKSGRPQSLRNFRENGVDPQKPCSSLKTLKNTLPNQEPAATEKTCQIKNNDLAEMPVLDKEEPVRGRISRKTEPEIPILMPYENEDKTGKSSKEQKSSKRKGVVMFKVVNKRRKSTESLDPLKIVKETELRTSKEKESLQAKMKIKTDSGDADVGETHLKKRKRSHLINESTISERKIPKTPKVKKYFLEICPNEIDKGGESKDDSGSDSEPLITFVINQKLKEKTDAPSESKEQAPQLEKILENDKSEEILPVLHPKEEEEEKILDEKVLDPVVVVSPKETKLKLKKEITKAQSPELTEEGGHIPPTCESELYFNQTPPEEKDKTLPEEVDCETSTNSLPKTPDTSKEKAEKLKLTNDNEPKKPLPLKKSLKGLKMTVKLKEATLKIVDCPGIPTVMGKWNLDKAESDDKLYGKDDDNQPTEEPKPSTESTGVSETKMERRSRRISKEIKSTTEFVIDDPLILVDELWSDLDSDSDNSKKRSKKNRKKSTKKKVYEERKENSVNLEELLRNFGESKTSSSKNSTDCKKLPIKLKVDDRRKRKVLSHLDKRKLLENQFVFNERSYKRLSLRLFKFHKKPQNFGGLGRRLLQLQTLEVVSCEPRADLKSKMPVLPFLTAEIKENPVQIIQCGAQKAKPVKKNRRKIENNFTPNIQLKISLPLQSINNLAVLNNNHLTEVLELDTTDNKISLKKQDPLTEKQEREILNSQNEGASLNDSLSSVKVEDGVCEQYSITPKDGEEPGELKLKSRRSEVIDKIFYCEICKTYYYSSSQLKIHKLSNRHKLKELELSQYEEKPQPEISHEPEKEKTEVEAPVIPAAPATVICEESFEKPSSCMEKVDADKLNDDTSEMPILEGPFIENPFVRMDISNPEPPKPLPVPSNVFGFTEDCLKDIQKAIGCTNEEMLILTLLGENSIELENDILDLDSCQPVTSNQSSVKPENPEESKERENSNGLLKMNFKKRITSALARLVNKAVLNLLQKYKNTNRTGISSEALSFLIRLSKVNNKTNILELDELLKNESEGESSNRAFVNEEEKKEHSAPYNYPCNVCGVPFSKENAREWHIIRSHRSKATNNAEEVATDPALVTEEEKEENVMPYKYLCKICGARFQKESSKEYHIIGSHRSKPSKSVEEPSSSPASTRNEDKREQNIPYKYLCTICGSRFQKESMWKCHIKRSHKSKGKKNVDELQFAQTTYEDDWSNTWTFDMNDELSGNIEAPQFLCSDCGINFTSPQEVLDHQKLEHASQKDPEISESGPLQSSTIGSSDEIIKGRRTPRRGSKHLSKAELDQQRIIANNELRKLDRKFSNKNKNNKVKWGMDALKFTVEKENKALSEPEEKEIVPEESPKPQPDPKNVDVIPKLNLSRTNNIPEFKVVQKTSCLNRFQRILDNKMKRKSSRNDAKEVEEKESLDKDFVEPLSLVKKEKKRKPIRRNSKKDDTRKVLDVYDFNDSESEPEPVAFSHVKKAGSVQSPTKLTLVKVKDPIETSKNKADSTTKDFETEDYDSEDSLPLSVVKKTKAEEDDEENRGEDQVEKHEGILEQVEYLIEQLENETIQPKSKEDEIDKDSEKADSVKDEKETVVEKKERSASKLDGDYLAEEESGDSEQETFRVSLENKFLQLGSLALKKKNEELEHPYESQESLSSDSVVEKTEVATIEKSQDVLPIADSSQGISDEEDSLPLVLMSKKNCQNSSCSNNLEVNAKKTTEIPSESCFDKEDTSFRIDCEDEEEDEEEIPAENDVGSPKISPETLPMISVTDNEENSSKSEKSYETLNGNVIYRRNDSMSGFESDSSDYDGLDSNPEKTTSSCQDGGESLIKEVMEKEDVVIVCSKKEQDSSKSGKKKESPKRKKQNTEWVQRKKKILPLLSVTLEENNFRKSESPKLSKEAIMKKIWSRRRFPEDLPDDSDNSIASHDNELSNEITMNEDSHSEIDKEIIMKKIWNKKRHENENGEVQVTKIGEKSDDVKIKETEISDEVVIRCGPKAKATPKRRKSKSSVKESSKERIMRKIWSGKCTFQTKAALKTYDSDIIHGSKENNTLEEQSRAKKRGRSSNFINSKKTKVLSDGEKSDEDDLDSLLEEIEREEVEKAIRLEFLQLRRSDKANVDIAKESGNMKVGLFAETCHKQGRELVERRRKKIRKGVKHPRKTLLKRRTFIKKSIVKQPPQQMTVQTTQQPNDDEVEGTGRMSASVEGRLKAEAEPSDGAVGTNKKSSDLESKMKNRKHKKHRHKHHHHKHKHKKSKHRKYLIGKHKMRHKPGESAKENVEEFENFSILEKMCQDIPSQIEKQSQKKFNADLRNLDTKLDEILMSTSSFNGKTKECDDDDDDDDDIFYEDRAVEANRNCGIETGNIYEFVEDDSGFGCDAKGRHKN